MAKPPKTKTLPESARGPEYDGPDVATALQIYDTDIRFALARDKRTFTLGSDPKNDIAIRDEHLSATHDLIERRGQGLRVHDQSTKNGTLFDGRRLEVFDTRPAQTFTAGRVRLLVLNDEMQAGFETLTEILGTPDEGTLNRTVGSSSACDVMVAATEGANLLIIGDDGCGQERLARVIHDMSLRRRRELVLLDHEPKERAAQRAIIDRAARSTLVLVLNEKAPVWDATFVSMLFSPGYHIRVIAIAPSAGKTRDILGELYVETMRRIQLAPLAQRPGAVPRLLDRYFAERGASLRFSDFSEHNQRAVQAYAWSNNLDDLRRAAENFIVLGEDPTPTWAEAAERLKVAPASLHYWFKDRLGCKTPLLARRR